jgi:hypothetical protein
MMGLVEPSNDILMTFPSRTCRQPLPARLSFCTNPTNDALGGKLTATLI